LSVVNGSEGSAKRHFNEYFDAGLPLLDDRVIAWEDGDSPFAFHDRTDEVREYRRETRRKERLARLADETDTDRDVG
jgi:hypothetical protein